MRVSLQGGAGNLKTRRDHRDRECSLSDGGLVLKESASQKHALSERKRRKRINALYDSLRQFFPRLHKADKASVLSETVRRLKELKNKIADSSPLHEDRDQRSGNKSYWSGFMPGEKDEVMVNCCDGGEKITVQAVICCEDRLDLNRGFMEAVQLVGGKVMKAVMATVGGRTKVEMVVELPKSGGRAEEDAGLLRKMLKSLVENRVLGRTRFMGHGLTEPEFFGLRQRFMDGRNPNVNDLHRKWVC